MKPRAWAAAAIVSACAAAYFPVLKAGFAYDDHIYIEDNAFVQDAGNWHFLFDWRFYGYNQGVLAGSRPVFLGSLMVDRALWGARPGGYHLTNLFLHAANALCVAVLGAGLGLGVFGGTLAGLLFAVQPLLSEAVCGVSFRPDLLAAFFAFGSVFLLRGAAEASRSGFLLRASAAAACMLLSLLAKESAALIAPASLLTLGLIGKLSRRRLAAVLALMAAVGLFYAAFRSPRFRYDLIVAPPETRRLEAASRILPPEAPRWQYPPTPPPWGELYVDSRLRAWTMSAEAGKSLYRLLVPGRPTIERAPVLHRSWTDWPVLAGWLALSAAAALAASYRVAPTAAAGAAWMLAALIPVLGLAPLYNPTADRYLYLPMGGAAWALAAAALALARRAGERERAAAAALTALFVLPWAWAARSRAKEWSSDKTLFFAETTAPQSPRIPYNRALLFIIDGRADLAEAQLLEAVRRHPGFAEAWSKLGALYQALGDTNRARVSFARGAAEPSPSPLPRYAFARFLERLGEREAAAAVYGSALARDPSFEPARAALIALTPAPPRSRRSLK